MLLNKVPILGSNAIRISRCKDSRSVNLAQHQVATLGRNLVECVPHLAAGTNASAKDSLRESLPNTTWSAKDSLRESLLNTCGVLGRHKWSPILLFPGMGASRLLLGARTIYPPSTFQYVTNFPQWKHNILHNTNLTTHALGDKRSLTLFPRFPRSNRYADLLRDPRVFPVPYDFRRIDDADYRAEFGDRVKAFIEGLHSASGAPVILVCHSTGGLVAHEFLHQQSQAWKDQYINSVVYVNVPFGGVVTVVEHCVRPDMPLNRWLGGCDVFQSLGSSVLNLPDHVPLTVDGVDQPGYVRHLGLDTMWARRCANQAVMDSFRASAGIPTHVVYSTTGDATTPTGLRVVRGQIQTTYGEGDGVVHLESLRVPYTWAQGNETKTLTFHHVPKMGHSSILE